MHENFLFVLGLTCFAGAATTVGSFIAFFAKRTNTRFLCAALGFSAGVMIYVSFVELLNDAKEMLGAIHGPRAGGLVAVSSFFAGILLAAVIDRLVPSYENPHEIRNVEEMHKPVSAVAAEARDARLMRAGVVFALAIALHNFPEGLATFMTGMADIKLGITVAVAIAIHNIPEGIAISVPVYYATGSRRKAFVWSALSGAAEPLGALAGYALLYPFMNDSVLGVMMALVAGIMVFISFDELLPMAEEYGEHHICLYGLIAGMAVMAVSLILV
ncbi:zinc transporter ZupT [Lentisphaerota bacterium ZTH]|nr:zinc transporter ZupT [Lentisphaerota bacterium]WET06097.1 zinc transporter ZupT [Lentisphaerota bacterium ZTH]